MGALVGSDHFAGGVEHLTFFCADAIGKPLIIHETANLVDLVDVSNWGRRRPRTAKSKGPRTPKKKADFLSAFDDKLKPDDKAKE